MDRITARLGLGALVAAIALSAGCAEERDPINRVQANAVSKHFFLGEDLEKPGDDPEFYWRNFVVDGSTSQSLVGVGSWGHVDRVRWEITEQYLIARKSYQIAQGADQHGEPIGTKEFQRTADGTVVAAYRIVSHFDIRRQYNPQTGEELNIIEENTTDRPWNQREFFRVDWSMNLVDNPMWQDVFAARVFGDLTITPIAYYVNDPTHDDAPHIEEEEGYLDITNRYYVAPATSPSPFIDFSGSLPTCLLVGIYTGSATYDCNAQEATVRSSYVKIDPDHDFEPLENTTAVLDVVGNPGGIGDSWSIGIVTAGVQGWDPQYGYTDPLYHRYANIHNIWKRSHQANTSCDSNEDVTDADGGDEPNGTADQCENAITGYSGSSGSQCDTVVGKCTIPYRDRELRTIAYWVNKEVETAAPELLDSEDPANNPAARGAIEDLFYSWNQLMSVAVAYAREVECRRTKEGTREECHADFFASDETPTSKQMVSYGGWLVDVPLETRPVITMCHNPVRSYDMHDVCGETGATARVGDVRKNFFFYWPYESRAPWGGIANWNADPLTGEIIGASATVMGRSATYAAAMQRDIILLAAGELQLDEIIGGVPAHNYMRMLQNGYSPQALTPEEVANRIKSVNVENLFSTVGVKSLPVGRAGYAAAVAKMKAASVADPRMTSNALLKFQAVASKLHNTPYEAELVDRGWLVQTMGMDPRTPASSVMDLVSPLRNLDSGRLAAFRSLMTSGLHGKGICFLDDEAPAVGSIYLGSLAEYFMKKYPLSDENSPAERAERAELIYKDLWKEAVKGIGLHEIGHSVGMLHNFTSSWDALNYNPQYWQLRTNEGKAMDPCTGPRTGNTDTCMGPRYNDPETLDELGRAGEPRPGIEYFGNTSTMEYQIERGGETVGLGTYDLHTMKALYGRVLETFDDRDIPLNRQQDFRFKHFTQLIEQDLVQETQIVTAHYTKTARMANIFNETRDCRAATDEEIAHATWRIVHGKVCSPPPKDHWRWEDFRSDSLIGGDPTFTGVKWHVIDSEGKDRVRWPYRWGAGHNSYFHNNDSDAGADAYEVTINTVKAFQATYPWRYFRRANREYYYRNIPFQTTDRYFERIRSYHWMVATDLARLRNQNQLEDDDDLKPYVMAEKEMFNLLAGALLMPEPGPYARWSGAPVDSKQQLFDITTNPTGTFTIGIVDGRYIGDEFDNDIGGSWDYQTWVKHVGFEAEKDRALAALVDGRPTLFTISRENFLDGRNVMINFRNDMPDAVDRLIGGLMSEDWESVAPYVPASERNPSPVMLDLSAKTPVRPANSRILFPNAGYRQQIGTAIYAALFSRVNSDMRLTNKMRIWVLGRQDEPAIDEQYQVRFEDPETHHVYVAGKFGEEEIDGKIVDKGIASRMIQHANALLAAAYKVQRDGAGEPILNKFGQPTLELDADGQPQQVSVGAKKKVRDYVGLLDSVYQIVYILGTGPL